MDQALIDQDKDFAGGGSADEYNDNNDFSRALNDEDDWSCLQFGGKSWWQMELEEKGCEDSTVKVDDVESDGS